MQNILFKGGGMLIGLTYLLCAVNANIVYTRSGAISGRTTNLFGKDVEIYIGIPYAQPPLEELRFKPPVPVKPWNGTYSATKNPPSCMQPFCSGNCSEDCLYLNIWVPSNANKTTSVMVWYHGGGFMFGSINDDVLNGSVIAAVEDVIVVTVAYRLGPFGFFCSETDDARGNMGMKDQVLALQWVKDNIVYFDGNPSSITIAGQSAGSISVSAHIVSPLTIGLFKSAIMQSGSAYISYLLIRSSSLIKSRSTRLAVLVGCASATQDISSNPSVMTCMKSRSASDLINADTVVMLGYLVGPENPWLCLFTPIYGDDFLPRLPILDLAVGNVHAENIMIGNVKDEGSRFMAIFANPTLLFTDDPLALTLLSIYPLARVYIGAMFRGLDNIRAEDVANYYLANTTFIDSSLLERSYNSIGDMTFHCPCVLLAENCSVHGKNVFYYMFTHRWSQSTNPTWMGTVHAAELMFTFGEPLRNSNSFLPDEIEFSRQLIGCWASFVKYGRPNYGKYSEVWTSYNDSRVAIDLNPYNVSIINPLKEACFFWNKYNRY